MNHPDTKQLHDLLAETLTLQEREVLAAHVDDCDECLDRLDALQRPRRSDCRLLADLLLQPPVESAGPDDPQPPIPVSQPSPPAQGTSWPQFPGYEMLASVGCGGMGQVYKVRHRATNRVVALKTLLPGVTDSADHAHRLLRFRNECEAIGRLQHPGIVAVYDVGEQDGVPYFTMEWVDGGSLADWLGGRPQPERLAGEWVAQLAEAVEQVHLKQIVHRDLKPANVLLASGGREPPDALESGDSRPPLAHLVPKLTDFGLAKLLDRSGLLTQPNQRMGTPEYVAPEQVTGNADSVGPAADVYGLGAILYEMLTGRPPFRADEMLETLRQVRDEDPLPPRRLRPRLSRDLETICLKCLRKDPRQRYVTARALAADLRRYLNGEPIHARPATVWERTIKWARRRPERAALVVIAGALFLALVVSYFGQAWSENARQARQLADAADAQLLLVKYAVSQTARETELRRLLQEGDANRRDLEFFMEKTREDFTRWFTRPGEALPIINWFVLNREGVILADSYPEQGRKSIGRNYGFRDYAAHLLGPDAPADRDAVYVSRLYESEQDGRFKFTVVTRVWDGDKLLGVLAASLAVEARLVALDMRREVPGAAVVGLMDDHVHPGEMPPERPRHIVVLHRDYATPGQQPAAAARTDVLDTFANDRSRTDAAVVFGPDGSFAHFARVGDTHFVAMVERSWPVPVNLLLLSPVVSAVAFAVLFILGATVRWFLRRSPKAHHDS